MKMHELKIQHKYLLEVVKGNKRFELRKNDRDYQVGDLIKFIDIDKPDPSKIEDYIKSVNASLENSHIENRLLYIITYVLKDVPEYGLDKNYCILGIKPVRIEEA